VGEKNQGHRHRTRSREESLQALPETDPSPRHLASGCRKGSPSKCNGPQTLPSWSERPRDDRLSGRGYAARPPRVRLEMDLCRNRALAGRVTVLIWPFSPSRPRGQSAGTMRYFFRIARTRSIGIASTIRPR
jgi:hypothetical protein